MTYVLIPGPDFLLASLFAKQTLPNFGAEQNYSRQEDILKSCQGNSCAFLLNCYFNFKWLNTEKLKVVFVDLIPLLKNSLVGFMQFYSKAALLQS